MKQMKKYQCGFVQGIGDAIANAIIVMIIGAFIAGGLFFGFLFYVVPILWEWLKPIIHGLTA